MEIIFLEQYLKDDKVQFEFRALTNQTKLTFQSLDMLVQIKNLDKQQKGYLLYSDLIPQELSNNLGYGNFLKIQFPISPISYNIVFSYIEKQMKKQSWVKTKIKSNFRQLIFKLFKNKWQLGQLKQKILQNIRLYVVSKNQKIILSDFSQYTHSQNLSINPKIVMQYICGQSCQIHISQNKQLQRIQKPFQIMRLKSIQNRLKERVNSFGNQWLYEKKYQKVQ